MTSQMPENTDMSSKTDVGVESDPAMVRSLIGGDFHEATWHIREWVGGGAVSLEGLRDELEFWFEHVQRKVERGAP